MKRLENKVAIITGGARGMGASHVRLFVSEGAKQFYLSDGRRIEKNAVMSMRTEEK